jgi:hypothetical protein
MGMRSAQQQLTGVHETLSVERRLRVRRSPSALTCVTLAENGVGIVANISETGMRLIFAEPLLENCLPHLCLRLPQLYGAIETRAEIVWVTESTREVGVRFVDLPKDVAEQIRMWVSRAWGDCKSQERKERLCNVEDHLSTASSAAAAKRSRPASGESVPQSWHLLFPSETGTTDSLEISASNRTSLYDPVEGVAAVLSTGRLEPEVVPALAIESELALGAGPDRNIGDTFGQADSRTPAQALCAAPPMLRARVDDSAQARLRTEPAVLVSATRVARMWPVAPLACLLIITCFVLGFVAGPEFSPNGSKAQDARQLVLEKLSRYESSTKNGRLSNQTVAKAAAPSQSASASSQSAVPDSPASTASETTLEYAAPHENDRGDNSTSQFAGRTNKGSSGVGTPDLGAPSAREPAVPEDSLQSGSEAPAASPEAAGSIRMPNDKTRDSRPITSRARDMAPENHAETSSSITGTNAAASPTENSAANTTAPAKAGTPTGLPDASLNQSAVPAQGSLTQQFGRSDVPAVESSVPSTLAAPPVDVPELALRPANPPPSFFPVVPPGAGKLPRLVELPSERIIDTANVVIHSSRFVFVPAEPGPESSHKAKKVQFGERISKVAPTYPAQTAQGMRGNVHLRAIIGKDGTVESVKTIDGPAILIPAAIDAIRQWRYGPTLLDRQPMEMQEEFTIEFRPLR